MSASKYFSLIFNKWVLSNTFLVLHLSLSFGQATNIGIPFTTNYSNEIYKAGTQTWDIDQHPNGFMFFANNNGLLQFDGINWELFPLKNKTIARSLHITQTGRIYVGGQGEFGYFEPDGQGLLVFHSLIDLVPPAHNNFADVWEIIELNGQIYYRASSKIFIYNGQDIQVLEKGTIDFLGTANQQIFVRNETGIHEIIGTKIQSFNGGDKFAPLIVNDVYKIDENVLLFSTLSNGLFTYKNGQIQAYQNDVAFFKQNKIHHIENLGNGQLAIGTANAGLIILGNDGIFLHKLDRKHGLQNNQTLSIFKDKTDNLWIGLNNGIDYVAMNSPFTKLLPDQDQEGTAYDAKIYQDNIYLGTSSGLYHQSWQSYFDPLKPNKFKRMPGSEGQVWGMDILEEDLFLGHHEGGFLIKNNQLQTLSSTLGNWKMIPLLKHPSYYLMGTYDGLVLYQKIRGNWRRIKQYEGFKESSRIIEQDQAGNIWIAHPYRGIYKVVISNDLSKLEAKLYGQKDGLPSNNLNHVFTINNEIVFTGEQGVFRYNASKDAFDSFDELTNLIGKEESIQRFFEDATGNIWYTTTKETGMLKIKDKGIQKSFTKITYPELRNKLVRGFEFIYPYDAHNVFIGAETGFIHFNPSKKTTNSNETFKAHLVKVKTIHNKDSVLLFGQYNSRASDFTKTLSYEDNALMFSYGATDYYAKQELQFSTKLEGFDENWSSWSTKREKDFTNLNSGNYQFLVKAKSIYGVESEIASFAFSIAPPWYASTQAVIIYALLIFSFLTGLVLVPRRKFQEEKAALEATQKKKEIEHLKLVAQSEQEIITLKNQQLEAQIAHKNSELAISTMHLVQRSELIQQIKDRLSKVAKSTSDSSAASELRKVNRLLNENAQLDDMWNQFAHHFDQVHIDFLQKIQVKYPQLTANDQKLCAYLRMNLSTKEMAPLMNISVRGVEVARYRLRKKLSLDGSVNLNKFMLEL